LDKKNLIEWSEAGVPRKKIYADEFLKKGKKRQDIWEFKDPQFPSYPTEKSIDMLNEIVEASSNPRDIVLDAFCGSGTTLLAAEELNRRWIGIDNSSLAIRTASKRLLQERHCKVFELLEVVE
jgi:adenine-specific DNA-methyltransferase